MAGYWYGLGEAGLREAAAETLAEARRLAPEATETWMAEAYYAYWVQLDYPRAEAHLARVLERSPEHAEAWMARSFVLRRDGRLKEALGAVRRVLEIDPVYGPALSSLGQTLTQLGGFDEAAAVLDQAWRVGHEVRRFRMELGLYRGDPEAAWAAVDGPRQVTPGYAFVAALATRDPQRIAHALSPALWPEDWHGPPGYSEAQALAQAEALLLSGQREEAEAALRAIQARLQALDTPLSGRLETQWALFSLGLARPARRSRRRARRRARLP